MMTDIIPVLLGWLTHHILVLRKVSSERGHTVWPWTHYRARPYKLLATIAGSGLGYYGVVHSPPGQSDYVVWFLLAVGLISDGISDKLLSYGYKKLDQLK